MKDNKLSPTPNFTLTDEQANDLARPLVGIIESFYQNPENEKKFQEWLKRHRSSSMQIDY